MEGPDSMIVMEGQVSTPRFSVRCCRRFPSLGWLGVIVLVVVGLGAAGCGKNPVDKRRTAEMAADQIVLFCRDVSASTAAADR